jgi:riboflavin kinase / FMN adenylyltransferase
MDIVTDPSTCVPPVGGSAVTIGIYDGVHLGHRALLGELGLRARAAGLTTVVVTFDRHPSSVIRPGSAPALLCDLDQKLELLEAAGVDRTVVVPFDNDRANETAEEFVDGVLVEGLGAKLVVVGEDFRFGHGRKGDVALLQDMGSQSGFEVEGISLQADRDGSGVLAEPISSTRIRHLIAEGSVEKAAVLLGRPHQVRGPVMHGDHRGGAELGFPTANVGVPEGICLPAAGIYAGFYERPDGSRW